MLKIKICSCLGRAVDSSLHEIFVVGMNSPEYRLQRGFSRPIKLKDLVGFLRPVEFSTRNVPAEAASVAQFLRFGQVSFALSQLLFRLLRPGRAAQTAQASIAASSEHSLLRQF